MFSIIIPLYNKELYIHYSIESVLNQTYNEFELIVVNDGSTDNSLKIVQSISDPRIIIINKLNGGESDARNTGIKVAKQKYITLLDADDLWDATYLFKMKKLIEDYPDASFFGCQLSMMNDNEIKIINQVHTKRGYIENYFKTQRIAPIVSSSSIVVRKECFNSVGYFNTFLKRGADLEMWVRLAKRYKLAFEPAPLSYWRLDVQKSARNIIPPLKNFYLEFNLAAKTHHERLYFLQLAELVMTEILINKKYKYFFYLVVKYNIYVPIIFIKIIIKYILSVINKLGFKINKK